MASIIDIDVTPDTWVDVYTTTGIDVGTAMTMFNKGNQTVITQESDTEPDEDSTEGFPMLSRESQWAKMDVDSGSSYIWLKVEKAGKTCKVAVQED